MKKVSFEQTKTVNIKIEYSISSNKKGIICSNIQTVQFIYGSKAVPGDLRDVEYIKENGGARKYFISFEALKQRKDLLNDRLVNTKTALEAINKILEDAE